MKTTANTKRITIELTQEECDALEKFQAAEGRNSLANAVTAAARRGVLDWFKNDPKLYQLPPVLPVPTGQAA